MATRLTINGTAHDVDLPENVPLLWVLRDEIGLTGTKFGCGVAACGACTVHIDGEAVRSCQIALADDTSLQVRELNGFPDIFAARFSGPGATYDSNARLLLDLMEGVPDASRQARFLTACCWIDPRPGKSAMEK